MSRLDKCNAIFEIGKKGMRVTLTSPLTGKIATCDMLGEAQGVVRFELEGVPALISKDAPEELPSEPSTSPPIPLPSPLPRKRGRPPKSRTLDSGTVTVDTSTIDEANEWRPQEV